MNPWSVLAQFAEDPLADTPLKKALWYILLPLAVLAIIFGGGYMLLRAERKAKAEKDLPRR